MTFPTTHPALARALAARDYAVPTAVQLAVLENRAIERDLLVSAQTGSGKTVAFGLAMATTLLGDSEHFERASEPMALIIAPTRELAMQVQRELIWLFAETGARIATCVGGMDGRAEARQLAAGAHIVVGTPGRLRDHLERGRLKLASLRVIVLDEADEMLDLGFREDLEFILDATPETRRTLLFSATMPRAIEMLAKRYQREAERIETIRRDTQHADIEYQVLRIAPGDVENAVVNVLRYHEAPATLVFCSTREAVKRMHAQLSNRGFSAVALSGELTQNERTHALQALRDNRARVLVATDVAARGLDLPDLALVIHADLPNDRETLLHRSGRTGRAGKKGTCVLIVPGNRRRKAEALLGAARLNVTWGEAPSAEQIRKRDQERFQADPVFIEVVTPEETALAAALQENRSADEIALALIRMNRARLPEPEQLTKDQGPPRRGDREQRQSPGRRSEWSNTGDSQDRPARDRDRKNPRAPRHIRDENRDTVWFRLNIGRERNADPKWLVPLICKSGNVSKSEIGSIKIFDRDTRFEIAAEHADAFAVAVRTNKNSEGHISRVGANSADDVAVHEAINAIPTSRAYSPAGKSSTTKSPPEKTGPGREKPRKDWSKSTERREYPKSKPPGATGHTPAERPDSGPRRKPKPGKTKRPHAGANNGPNSAKPGSTKPFTKRAPKKSRRPAVPATR